MESHRSGMERPGRDPFAWLDGTKVMYHVEALARWKRGEHIPPVHVDLGVHNGCNYRCRHCYLGHLGHEAQGLDRRVLLDLMESLGRIGVKSIFVAGSGEPLLNPALPDAIVAAGESGVDIAMATNGRALSPELSSAIVPRLSWIRFSIQAGREETYRALHRARPGDLESVMANVAGAVAARARASCRIGVLTCLVPGNEGEVALLAARVRDLGVDYYTVRPPSTNPRRPMDLPVYDTALLADELDRAEALADDRFRVIVRRNLFRDQVRRPYRRCLGLPFITQIDGDGGVYACGVFVGEPAYCYGNLREESFERIWSSERCRTVMARVMAREDFSACDNLCRLHNVNKYLWDLAHPPEHVNFI